MDDTLRKRIIEDLLRNKPRGPTNFAETPSLENNFGYKSNVIFQLGLKTEFDCRVAISDNMHDGKLYFSDAPQKRVLTRRTKRLWGRIKEAVREVQKVGGLGVYKVRSLWGYSTVDVLGYVHAKDPEDAKQVANVIYAYLSRDSKKRIAVDFIEFGDVDRVACYEADLKDKLSESMTREKKKFYEAEGMIEYLTTRLGLLDEL